MALAMGSSHNRVLYKCPITLLYSTNRQNTNSAYQQQTALIALIQEYLESCGIWYGAHLQLAT